VLSLGKSMRIGQVSKQTGISIDTIRFYERKGLLAAPPRTEVVFASTLPMMLPRCNSFVAYRHRASR
jgi:MerR family regulatory protein